MVLLHRAPFAPALLFRLHDAHPCLAQALQLRPAQQHQSSRHGPLIPTPKHLHLVFVAWVMPKAGEWCVCGLTGYNAGCHNGAAVRQLNIDRTGYAYKQSMLGVCWKTEYVGSEKLSNAVICFNTRHTNRVCSE